MKLKPINVFLIACCVYQGSLLLWERSNLRDVELKVAKIKERIPEYDTERLDCLQCVNVTVDQPSSFVWRCCIPVDDSRYFVRTQTFDSDGYVPIDRALTKSKSYQEDFIAHSILFPRKHVWNRTYSAGDLLEGSGTEHESICSFLSKYWVELRKENHLEKSSVSDNGQLDLLSVYVPAHLMDEMRAEFGSYARIIEQGNGLLFQVSIESESFRQRSEKEAQERDED